MTKLGIRGQIIALLIIAPSIITALLLASTLITTAQNRSAFARSVEGPMQNQAQLQLQQWVESTGQHLSDRLFWIQSETRVAAYMTADILNHPRAFNRYWVRGQYTINGEQVYGTFTPNADGSHVYVSNVLPLSPAVTSFITQSEFLDIPYRSILQANSFVHAVSINTPSQVRRGYPSIDISRLPSNIDITKFMFYQLAHEQVGPSYEPIWSFPHVDPFSHEWVVTSAMPVYGSDKTFLGVTALDVSMTDLLTTTMTLRLPYAKAVMFVLGQDGTVLSAPLKGSGILGVGAIPTVDEIVADEGALRRVNLTQSRNEELAQAAQEMLRAQGRSLTKTITIDNEGYLLITTPIPGPRWVLGILVPTPDFTALTVPLDRDLQRKTEQFFSSLLLAAIALLVLVGVIGVFFARRLTRPIIALERGAQMVANGDFSIYIPTMSEDELGRLSTSFNLMTRRLRQAQLQVQQAQESLEHEVVERTTDLNQRSAELALALTELHTSTATLRALSTPLIPVFDGVLVMPLIGNLDEERGRQILQQVLASVDQNRSRVIIIDVTGMTILDDQVAAILTRAAQAVRLLGAEAILVGMRPEVAQALVSLDLDISTLSISATLESGLRTALYRLGYTIHARGRQGD